MLMVNVFLFRLIVMLTAVLTAVSRKITWRRLLGYY